MESSNEALQALIGSLHEKGVQLWSEDGRLHYRAPRDLPIGAELEQLRARKSEVMRLLGRARSGNGYGASAALLQARRAPLAFSQIVHWNTYDLSRNPSVRQVASIMHLRGRLDADALEHSLQDLAPRHDALRTQIVAIHGQPIQEVHPQRKCALEREDISGMPRELRADVVDQRIAAFILEPVVPARDPLLAVKLWRLDADHHVLVIAMEHMISDGCSVSIVSRELLAAYRSTLLGRSSVSMPTATQFSDYALEQRRTVEAWYGTHGRERYEHLAGCEPVRFPESRSGEFEQSEGRGNIRLRIGPDIKRSVGEWCRANRTTLVMGVFTIYVALLLRWCRQKEAIVAFQSDGRRTASLADAIGYYSAPLYLRIRQTREESIRKLLPQVAEEYYSAYEHADSSYFAAQKPRPEFTRTAVFNWVPQGAPIDLSGLEQTRDALICSPAHIENPLLKRLRADHEPSILLFDTQDGILADLTFPLARFSREAMDTFAQNFLRSLASAPT